MTKKYTDWASWGVGLRTNLIKCLGTTGTAWLGTLAVSNMGIPGLAATTLNWKQAVAMFAAHLGLEAFTYMRDNQPKVITETTETTVETSKVVTTTQAPADSDKPQP